MRILIIGGGKDTEELLSRLDLRKNSVVVIEKNPERRKDIMSRFDVIVIGRDATDSSIYTKEINVNDIDAIVALTNDDETNIFITALGKLMKIPYRICKLKEPEKEKLVRELGLGIPISGDYVVSFIVETYLKSLKKPIKMGEVELNSDKYHVYVYTIPQESTLNGKALVEVKKDLKDIVFLLVFDGKKFFVPDENYILQTGDQLILMVKDESVVNKVE